jgi:hypothetical protein
MSGTRIDRIATRYNEPVQQQRNEPEPMMNAMTEMPAPFVFTDAAAAKVKTLIDEEGNPDLKLRVFVSSLLSRSCLCFSFLSLLTFVPC